MRLTDILNPRETAKLESLELLEEAESIYINCECGINNTARLEDLEKLRKWEIMDIVGNYLDPKEEVAEWTGFKRIATFCKAYELNKADLIDFYTLAIDEGGEEIAYQLGKSSIILILGESQDTTPTQSPNQDKETDKMKNQENLVNPVNDSRTTDPLYKALQVSGSHKGSKYNLTKGDRERGFYFIYQGLEVPFKAIFNMNNKTDGILGVAFGTAKDCPSQALGLCQLPSDRLCYARSGEARATKRDNERGEKGMDSYFNGLLCSAFWDAYETDKSGDIRNRFEAFLIHYDIETLRFNLKGDFRHSLDITAIYYLATCGLHLTGYTARDDLAELLEKLGSHPNIILNGSNRMYTNRFKATADLEEFQQAKYKCLGNCSACQNCYRLRGVEIVCLIHGSGSDTALNNEDNRIYIQYLAELIGLDIEDAEFETAKGLLTCVNKYFKKISNIQFKSIKEALKFLSNQHYYYVEGEGYGWTLYNPNGFHVLHSEDFEDIEVYADCKGFQTIWGEI